MFLPVTSPLAAQEAAQQPAPDQAASGAASQKTLVTVHGVVRNAATGAPLPRALVKVDSGDTLGALTDGEGHFEIPGVPVGMQVFNVVKPGFRAEVETNEYTIPISHTVQVTAEMPDLAFSLSPTNAIYGEVALSTGDPAVGMGLTLFKLTIQEGRARWIEADSHQATTEGEYRFAGLEDGSYMLMTQPAFDNERARAPACDGPAPAAVPGYPIAFYGNASDAAGAARIAVSGGMQSRADLMLTQGNFHAVQAVLAKPPIGGNWQFTYALLDGNGQRLSYPLRQDDKNHSVCAYLPDGSYTLTVVGTTDEEPDQFGQPLSRQAHKPRQVAGMLDFSVDNRAESRLRLPLGSGVSTPIYLHYEPEPPAPRQAAAPGQDSPEGAEIEPDPLSLSAVPANGAVARGENRPGADWVDSDRYELQMVAPGLYWISVTADRSGTCLGAVTAGGINLAQTAWPAGHAGTGPAIDVVLRTDCSKLTLQLPASMQAGSPGEEPRLFAYIVPDFDSIAPMRDVIMQQSAGGTTTLEDLTPGAYRVFVFDTPHSLEYQNPAAMAQLTVAGQAVTLPPSGTANLVLEIPSR